MTTAQTPNTPKALNTLLAQILWNFRKDVHGTLQNAAHLMRRTAEKNADFLLASLLQNGNVANCWHTGTTGKKFFDTNIPCDLASNLSGETFTNYYTNTPLTAANILKRIGYAKSIKLGDRVPISVNLDTLLAQIHSGTAPGSADPAAAARRDEEEAAAQGQAGDREAQSWYEQTAAAYRLAATH